MEVVQPRLKDARTDLNCLDLAEGDFYRFILEVYQKYKEVFTWEAFDKLLEHSEFDHVIELKDMFVPENQEL